jgi:DNA adenine methylase
MLTRQGIKNNIIKSPLNYIGGKTRILNQILPLFPKDINNFVDLFAGGFNVGINVNARKVYCNDNLTYLIDLFRIFKETELNTLTNSIEKRIKEYSLSQSNQNGYIEFRRFYNKTKQPLDLFVLIAFSFNHQIRFNNNHEFNNPFGKNRSCFNHTMKTNLEKFVIKIKEMDIEFSSKCFSEFNFSFLSENDFVYCDPPYLITTGTYNDGKRGFKGWGSKEEIELLERLDKLSNMKVNFALSNVIVHKGKSNKILENWLKLNPSYIINSINYNYSNSNYQTLIREKNASKEVLITNYNPQIPKQNSLFDEICKSYEVYR